MEWGRQEWVLGTSLHFFFPWIGISLLLRAIQYHYYCIHMMYWETAIRDPKPMFCYIYFSHWAFTLTSKSCEETLFNHISFTVEEDLHQKCPKNNEHWAYSSLPCPAIVIRQLQMNVVGMWQQNVWCFWGIILI